MHRLALGGVAGLALLIVISTQFPRASAATDGFATYLPLIVKAKTSTPPPTGSPHNLQASAATYLGGNGSDTASAVDVAPDGSVVLGGVLPGYSGGTETTLLGGTDGAVVRLDSSGRTVRSVTRIGTAVNDLEINDDGVIAVCGDFGVAALDASASTLAWSANPGEGRRCAIGADGSVAVLVGSAAYVYDKAGTPRATIPIAGSGQYDIAVDGVNKLVIASGFTQVSGNLQVAFMRAWSYDGTLTWKSYDFPNAPGLGADTRGERIAIGRDGKLYFVGSINGGTGVSIFSRDPKDINVKLGSDRNITSDTYNQATNVGSVKMMWFGRYNSADGALEAGSSLLTRLTSGKGNSIVARAITADENGRVFLAGDTACCLPNRDKLTISGTPVGPYEGGEAFLAVISADLKKRPVWTAFAAPDVSAGGSPAVGVAVRGPVAAVALTLNAPTNAGQVRKLITYEALQPAPATLPDAYVAVWNP